jgi:hypothetical protein
MKPCRGLWKQKVHLSMARRSRLPGACIYPSAQAVTLARQVQWTAASRLVARQDA